MVTTEVNPKILSKNVNIIKSHDDSMKKEIDFLIENLDFPIRYRNKFWTIKRWLRKKLPIFKKFIKPSGPKLIFEVLKVKGITKAILFAHSLQSYKVSTLIKPGQYFYKNDQWLNNKFKPLRLFTYDVTKLLVELTLFVMETNEVQKTEFEKTIEKIEKEGIKGVSAWVK